MIKSLPKMQRNQRSNLKLFDINLHGGLDMQTLYFACTSDAVGKQDELQSNWLHNSINRGMRCDGMTPQTSRWDAQEGPHPRRGGGNKRRDVEDEGPFSLHACLSLFFPLNLICLLFYFLLSSIGRDPLYL